jgi:hypothetical protein
VITLPDAAAFTVAGATVVAITAWASFLSVRSAADGPAWAVAHLSGARAALTAVPVAGVLAFLVFEPRWMGLVVAYVGLVGAGLSWALARSLIRLRDADGFGDVPLERRRLIVSRARRRLTIAGIALVAGGAVLIGTGAVGPGLVVAGMGASLAGTALLIAPPAAARP